MERKDDDFEFDCPQFTDFTKQSPDGSPNGSIGEEECRKYFDNKAIEIKQSIETNQEEEISNADNTKTIDNTNNNKENCEPAVAPSNLLSVSFTSTNTSNVSMKSCTSHRSISNLSKISQKATNVLSTEQMEIEKLKQQKADLKKLQKQNAKHVAKMRDDQYVFQPVRSTKLTIPISPAFQTSMRANKRRSERQRKQSAVPTANDIVVKKNERPTKTIPKSFKLCTKSRRRRKQSNALSTDAKAIKEIEKRGAFKAKKLNPKMFKKNALGSGILNNVKTNNKATKTIPKSFNFQTEKRAKIHNNKVTEETKTD